MSQLRFHFRGSYSFGLFLHKRVSLAVDLKDCVTITTGQAALAQVTVMSNSYVNT